MVWWWQCWWCCCLKSQTASEKIHWYRRCYWAHLVVFFFYSKKCIICVYKKINLPIRRKMLQQVYKCRSKLIQIHPLDPKTRLRPFQFVCRWRVFPIFSKFVSSIQYYTCKKNDKPELQIVFYKLGNDAPNPCTYFLM